tara:strand:+ start:39 stop:194 length:156 start_codon:yes stop_codon:yes gene_type:complete
MSGKLEKPIIMELSAQQILNGMERLGAFMLLVAMYGNKIINIRSYNESSKP